MDEMEDLIINRMPKCVHCGSEENLSTYSTPEGNSILCDECAEELQKKIDNYSQLDNNYIQGFFASLLGAIAGSVIWILLGFINVYASFAGYAIAAAAFWAYGKAGGKLNKVGVVLNIITVILGIIFAEYAGIALSVIRGNPGYSFIEYINAVNNILFIPEFLKHEAINLLLGGLFAFLGCQNIVRTNMATAKKMENFWLKKINRLG